MRIKVAAASSLLCCSKTSHSRAPAPAPISTPVPMCTAIYQFGLQVRQHLEPSLQQVGSADSMHTWLQGPLVDALFGQGSAAGLKPGLGELHGVDYIIGAVRIAQVWLVTCARMQALMHALTLYFGLQLRVTERACTTVPAFVNSSFTCAGRASDGEWSEDAEDRAPFGLGPRKFVWEGWDPDRLLWDVERERGHAFSMYRATNDKWYSAPAFSVLLSPRDQADTL